MTRIAMYVLAAALVVWRVYPHSPLWVLAVAVAFWGGVAWLWATD